MVLLYRRPRGQKRLGSRSHGPALLRMPSVREPFNQAGTQEQEQEQEQEFPLFVIITVIADDAARRATSCVASRIANRK